MKTAQKLAFAALFAFGLGVAHATPDSTAEVTPPEKSGDIVLPAWQEGELRGEFDIRIWPEAVVAYMERENLRQMINDPNIPEEERANLRQILVMQTAQSLKGMN